MEAADTVKASIRLQKIYDAIIALPDEERSLVVDLMRALPRLTEPDGEGRRWGKGDVVRMRLEEFVDGRRAVQLSEAMGLYLTADQLAVIGRAIFSPDLDEEVSRAKRFGPERK